MTELSTQSQLAVDIPDATVMQDFGASIARLLHGHDVVFLSGPLGAGKTTLAQGIGRGLSISESLVSPTFTIARQLRGSFSDGSVARLIHVDAYRIVGDSSEWDSSESVGGSGAGSSALSNRLFDEFESLGLDEEIDSPSNDVVILIEWGERFTHVLGDSRLEVAISRPLQDGIGARGARVSGADSSSSAEFKQLTSAGTRKVVLRFFGDDWLRRLDSFDDALSLVEGIRRMNDGRE